MAIGKDPPELLGRRVSFTAVPLVFGLGILVWCLGAGIAWARGK